MNRRTELNLAHLERLCAEHGIIQFANGSIPDRSSGFCLDDNVRLLIAGVDLLAQPSAQAFARGVVDTVFDFIAESAQRAPMYRNLMDEHGRFIDRFASPESIGRLIRALGIVVRDATDPRDVQRALAELRRATGATAALTSVQSRSFAILGWAAAVEGGQQQYCMPLQAAAEALLFELERNSSADWYWPIDMLDYDVARIPEALLRAGTVLADAHLERHGLRALEWLASIVQPGDIFEPIGAPAWYRRDGRRTYYSQQPLEALAMMELWLAAGEDERARDTQGWFHGENSDGLVLAAPSGGCCDAIHAAGELNRNMGAESTLAYVQAELNLSMLNASEIVA